MYLTLPMLFSYNFTLYCYKSFCTKNWREDMALSFSFAVDLDHGALEIKLVVA
jgi:hypothetical protein